MGVDTAGTLITAAQKLREAGATRVFAFATHGLLSGKALERIGGSQAIHELVITDSINPKKDERTSVPNIKIVSIGVLIADGLRRIYLKESLGGVFYEGFDAETQGN